jgi:uncharacterized membrane protein YfcA
MTIELPPIELLPIAIFSLVGLIAFFVRGVTGAASAIVSNACFLVILAGGSVAGLTLLDAIYWIALVDVAATLLLAWPIRHQLMLDPIARRFILGAVPVNVAFTLLLPRVDLAVLGLGLGVAVAAAGLYLAYRRSAPPVPEPVLRPWAPAVGAASGVLGGLYGMGGPVAILFLSRLEDDPTRFRARVTSIFAITGSIRLIVLFLAGSYTPLLLAWGFLSLPAIALGLAIGFRVHRYVEPVQFRLILGVLVALAGIVGALRAITG